ncbi:MAG: EpsG family protein [Leucobacter sp.]
MILTFSDLAAKGLLPLFLLFILVLLFLRLGTKATTRMERLITFPLAWLILTVAPTFRVIDGTLSNVGRPGDADKYREQFLSSAGAEGIPLGSSGTTGATEPLYLLLIRLLRQVTDNPHVFFFIMYGLIAFGFVYFAAKTLRADTPILPLIIMFPAWLHSFSGIRNWVGIALVLVGFVWYMRGKTLTYYLFVALATGFHFSAALLFLLPTVIWLLFRRKGVMWAVSVLVIINILSVSLSGVLSSLLRGTRYEAYLVLESSDFTLVLPMAILTFVGILFVQPSDSFSMREKRLVNMPIFMAGVITMILNYGGYRYVLYPVLPLAVVSAWALMTLPARFPNSHPTQLAWKFGIYGTVFIWTAINLSSVLRFTTVFPVIWGP